MALSNDLISQFVKVTKDEKPAKKETTVYATVEQIGALGEPSYVRFDGSSVLTPAILTTNVALNERVMVMVKNHSAIITGNVSSPSARTGEVESVNEGVKTITIRFGEFQTEVEDYKVETDNVISSVTNSTNVLTQQHNDLKYTVTTLSNAVAVEEDGVHVFTPGYKNLNEIRIDADSVDVRVGGVVYSSFIPKGTIYGNYKLWQPDSVGGLAFSLISRS